MKSSSIHSFDFRQSPFWADYMKRIGWELETIDELQIYIRKIPYLGSFIKIQHPFGKIPFKKIDAVAQKHNAIFVIIEPTLYKYSDREYKNNGYLPAKMHHAPTATRKIDIHKSIESIIASFSENAKRNLKKGEKNYLVLKTIFAKDDKKNEYFEQFFKLQKNLTDMKKFYAPGYDESKKKYEALKKGSFFVFAHERNNKTPIAAVWYGYYKGVVTYLQTGITQQGYDTLANYLLVLEGIKTGKKLGCTVFDFESIYDPRYPNESKRWKGYSEFKSRFHGEAVFYPSTWINAYHPFFRWFFETLAPFLP